MRRIAWILPMLAGMAVMSLASSFNRAADVPIQSLDTWKRENDAGWALLNQGNYARAEERFRLAIEQIRPYEKENPGLLARSYADLARVLYHQGRYADAEPLARWSLAVREADVKANPGAAFQSLYALARIEGEQGNLDEAEPLLRRALDLQETAIGPTHVQTAETLDELAKICELQKKYDEAEPFYQRAIFIYMRFNPRTNRDLADCAERYGAMLRHLGRASDARMLLDVAEVIRTTIRLNAEQARDMQARPEFQGFRKGSNNMMGRRLR